MHLNRPKWQLAAEHYKSKETMKVTINKTHILLPVAGFVTGGLYVLLYAFIDYCDTAPLDESFYDIIPQILSHNDVRLAIYLWGFIGFTLGCIANLLVGFLQKHIKRTK